MFSLEKDFSFSKSLTKIISKLPSHCGGGSGGFGGLFERRSLQ